MTKEELWKEAIKRVDAFIDNLSQDIRSTLYDRLNQEDVKDFLYGLYFDSAEPREKQIEIDAKQIRALQKQNGELTDKVKELEEKLANADYQLEGRDNEIRELEAQIEKMKVCQNCNNWNWKHNKCEKKLKGDCFKHSKWVMRNY